MPPLQGAWVCSQEQGWSVWLFTSSGKVTPSKSFQPYCFSFPSTFLFPLFVFSTAFPSVFSPFHCIYPRICPMSLCWWAVEGGGDLHASCVCTALSDLAHCPLIGVMKAPMSTWSHQSSQAARWSEHLPLKDQYSSCAETWGVDMRYLEGWVHRHQGSIIARRWGRT